MMEPPCPGEAGRDTPTAFHTNGRSDHLRAPRVSSTQTVAVVEFWRGWEACYLGPCTLTNGKFASTKEGAAVFRGRGHWESGDESDQRIRRALSDLLCAAADHVHHVTY